MVTALNELLEAISDNKKTTLEVKCAVVAKASRYSAIDCPECILDNPKNFSRTVILKENWDNDAWLSFLEGLRFNYDDSYGWQELYGVVWFKDGSWLEREEYDGSEWWTLKQTPAIPKMLQGV